MKRMYILMSHSITQQQMNDAKKALCIEHFVVLPTDRWSQIPAENDTVESSLLQLKAQLSVEAKQGDVLLVQGDYGATFNMVQFAKERGIVPVYATSKRKAYEITDGEKITTVREFQHVRFRKY